MTVAQWWQRVMTVAFLLIGVVLTAWIVATAPGWVALGLLTWWVSARIAGVVHRC